MGQRETERKLKRYAQICNAVVPKEREKSLQILLRYHDLCRKSVECTRGTVWDFLWEQLGYLGRYCLVWQSLWALLFCYLTKEGSFRLIGGKNGREVLALVSMLPPLLVLLTVEEVTKIYHKSMLEIEYATKYSLRSVVMVRMVVLCIFHSVILVVCMIFLHGRLGVRIGEVLVYGFTPMLLITGILLKLMQYCQGEMLRGISAGLYGLTVLVIIAGNTERLGWFHPSFFKIWCMACAAGILFVGWQFVKLNGKLGSFERMVF